MTLNNTHQSLGGHSQLQTWAINIVHVNNIPTIQFWAGITRMYAYMQTIIAEYAILTYLEVIQLL